MASAPNIQDPRDVRHRHSSASDDGEAGSDAPPNGTRHGTASSWPADGSLMQPEQTRTTAPRTSAVAQPSEGSSALRLVYKLAVFVALTTLYVAAAQLGLKLAFVHAKVTAVWPPTGIALAAMLLLGYRCWPAVIVGAFLANLAVGEGGPITAAGIAAGNTLEALAGAWLVNRFASGRRAFDRPRTIFAYVGAVILATALCASWGVTALSLTSVAQWQNFREIWLTWWMGDLVSALVIAPLILVWMRRSTPRLAGARVLEAAGLAAIMLLLGVLMFAGVTQASVSNLPLAFLFIPPMFWAAMRFQQRGATGAAFMISCVALWGTLSHAGPFAVANPNTGLLVLQAFMGTVAATMLVVGALVGQQQRSDEELRRTLAQRRQAEHALGLSEQRFRLALSASPIMVFTYDCDLRCTWAYNTHPAYPVERLVGKTDEEAIPGPLGQRLMRLKRQALERGEGGTHEVELELDGQTRTFDLFIEPMRDEWRGVIGVAAAAVDVTARNRDERRVNALFELTSALGRAQGLDEVYEAALDALEQALRARRASILLRDPDGVMRFKASRGLSAQYRRKVEGHSPWAPGERDPRPIVIANVAEADLGSLRQVVQDEGIAALGFFPLVDRGELIGKFMVYFDQPRRFSDDEVQLAGAIAGHIAHAVERARAQDRAAELNRRLAATIDASPLAVVAIDESGIVQMWNKAAERIFGWSAEEALGRWWPAVPEEHRAQQLQIIQRTLRGEPAVGLEVRRQRKNGTLFDAELWTASVPGAGGADKLVLSILADITQRKGAEQEIMRLNRTLGQRVDELSTLLKVAPVGIAVAYDAACTRVDVNEACARMIGIEAGENASSRGPNAHRLPSNVKRRGADVPQTDLPMQKAIRLRRPVHDDELEIRRSDGQVVHLLVSASPLLDDHGSPRGCVAVMMDITARTHAESALRREREKLQKIIDIIPVMITLHDPSTGALDLNPQFQRVTGWTSQADQPPTYATLLEQCFPDPAHRQHAQQFLEAAREGWMDIRMRAADGRDIEASWASIRLSDQSQLGIGIDISERKRAENALRESEARFRTVADSAPVLIWMSGERKQGVYFNRTWLEFTGRALELELGEGWLESVHPEDLPRLRAWFDTLRREPFTTQFRLRRHDGIYRWVLETGTPRFTADGEFLGYIGSCLDITDLEEARTSLKSYSEKLEELVHERTRELELSHQQLRTSERMAAMGTMAAGLGHDMGNLLLPVKVRLDVLARMELAPEVREHLDAIAQCAKYLQTLVSGLRLFALDPKESHVQSETTDLEQWAANVKPFYRGVLPRHTGFDCQVAANLPAVKIAPAALTQAVLNLINNARDAIGPGKQGRVTLRAASEPGQSMVRVSVVDDGPGIPPHVQARVFEPFFTTKTRRLSTGLGLSLVHGIVTGVGGEVCIDSPVGGQDRGAAVALLLPVVAPAACDGGRGGDRPTTARISVQDERSRAMIGSFLETMGMSVLDSNGVEPGECDVWITDGVHERLDAASRFMHERSTRRVLVMAEECDERWSRIGASALPTRSASALRQALHAALRSS